MVLSIQWPRQVCQSTLSFISTNLRALQCRSPKIRNVTQNDLAKISRSNKHLFPVGHWASLITRILDRCATSSRAMDSFIGSPILNLHHFGSRYLNQSPCLKPFLRSCLAMCCHLIEHPAIMAILFVDA
jgi:hypothetical protein